MRVLCKIWVWELIIWMRSEAGCTSLAICLPHHCCNLNTVTAGTANGLTKHLAGRRCGLMEMAQTTGPQRLHQAMWNCQHRQRHLLFLQLPVQVGTSSPSRSMTTEEICRLPTLPLGETDEAAPTLHDTQSMARQDSVLVHGASFFDETPDGKICEAHHAMGEGEGQGIL